jgi:hypothetical protein
MQPDTDNGGKNDRGAWSDAPAHHSDVWAKMEPVYNAIVEKYPKLDHKQRVNHLGTLGTASGEGMSGSTRSGTQSSGGSSPSSFLIGTRGLR